MKLLTVKLDDSQAARLEEWSGKTHRSKSEIVRHLIDDAVMFETGDDLESWLNAREGASLGLEQKNG